MNERFIDALIRSVEQEIKFSRFNILQANASALNVVRFDFGPEHRKERQKTALEYRNWASEEFNRAVTAIRTARRTLDYLHQERLITRYQLENYCEKLFDIKYETLHIKQCDSLDKAIMMMY